jgi:hypothetical protein
MLNVPDVVTSVGTDDVAVAGNVFTELGAMVHVTPGGAPEVTLRLTVPVDPPAH